MKSTSPSLILLFFTNFSVFAVVSKWQPFKHCRKEILAKLALSYYFLLTMIRSLTLLFLQTFLYLEPFRNGDYLIIVEKNIQKFKKMTFLYCTVINQIILKSNAPFLLLLFLQILRYLSPFENGGHLKIAKKQKVQTVLIFLSSTTNKRIMKFTAPYVTLLFLQTFRHL